MSKPSAEGRKKRSKMVLNGVEKADGKFPGTLVAVEQHLGEGVPSDEVPPLVNKELGTDVGITGGMVENHRNTRWVDYRNRIIHEKLLLEAIVAVAGGDAGLDLKALAKLWEKMDEMSIPQIIATREVFLKIRAQNLKEQEFLFKTGQLKVGDAAEKKVDAQQQQRNVLKRIKEIFGLSSDDVPEGPAGEGEGTVAAPATTTAEPVAATTAVETPAKVEEIAKPQTTAPETT